MIALPRPSDFSLPSAVCSHGWFVLAPNRWDPSNRLFHTTIALGDERAVRFAVRETERRVTVMASHPLSSAERKTAAAGVIRMLRLTEDLAPFQHLCRTFASHRRVRDLRFGRLLRSPSLFEDVIKVMCTCNVTWRQTVSMIERLVGRWGVEVESGSDDSGLLRAFPTAQRLAAVRAGELREVARLGYRAEWVSRLSRDVAEGRIDLSAIEQFDGPTRDLHRMLKRIHGVGDYAAGHLCMLLGRYDCLAIDTELMRFLKERHPRRRFTPASIHRYYQRWAPWQFLAYWWELWQDYESRHGPSGEWVSSTGRSITSG